MPSVLKVNEIQNTQNLTAMEIDSSGVVTHPQKPHVSVQFGGSTTYLSHTNEAIKFSSVLEGDSSLYDTSTYKFTCPVAGVYLASFHLIVQTATSLDISLYRNSTVQNRTYFSVDRGVGSAYAVVCSADDELYWHLNGSTGFYQGTGNNRYSWGTYTLIG